MDVDMEQESKKLAKGKMLAMRLFARTVATLVFATVACAAMLSCQSDKATLSPAETVAAISAGKYGPAREIEGSQEGGVVFEDSAYIYRFNPDLSLALVEAKASEKGTGEVEPRFDAIAHNQEAADCIRQLLFAAMPGLDIDSASVLVRHEQAGEDGSIYVVRISERKEGHLTGNSLLAQIWPDGTLESLMVLAFRIDEQEALDIAYAAIADHMRDLQNGPIDFAFFELSLADRSSHVLNGGLVERQGRLVWDLRIDGIFIAKGSEHSFFVDVDAQTGECRIGICRQVNCRQVNCRQVNCRISVRASESGKAATMREACCECSQQGLLAGSAFHEMASAQVQCCADARFVLFLNPSMHMLIYAHGPEFSKLTKLLEGFCVLHPPVLGLREGYQRRRAGGLKRSGRGKL